MWLLLVGRLVHIQGNGSEPRWVHHCHHKLVCSAPQDKDINLSVAQTGNHGQSRRSIPSWSPAVRLGDADLYRNSRYDLHKVIWNIKRQYWSNHGSQTNTTNTCSTVAKLESTMDYKVKAGRIIGCSSSLHDLLNAFHSHFEQGIQWNNIICSDNLGCTCSHD